MHENSAEEKNKTNRENLHKNKRTKDTYIYADTYTCYIEARRQCWIIGLFPNKVN